jgi:hypothetical protein
MKQTVVSKIQYNKCKGTPSKISSVENMLLNSQTLKNKLKISSTQALTQESCTSAEGSERHLITVSSMNKSEFENSGDICTDKKSGTLDVGTECSVSTYQSNNNYSAIMRDQNAGGSLTLDNETKAPLPPSYLSHYNFGGLIPLPEKEVKTSQLVEDP